jgi:hypothetical protein
MAPRNPLGRQGQMGLEVSKRGQKGPKKGFMPPPKAGRRVDPGLQRLAATPIWAPVSFSPLFSDIGLPMRRSHAGRGLRLRGSERNSGTAMASRRRQMQGLHATRLLDGRPLSECYIVSRPARADSASHHAPAAGQIGLHPVSATTHVSVCLPALCDRPTGRSTPTASAAPRPQHSHSVGSASVFRV